MPGFKGVISCSTEAGDADVSNGEPAFEPVVSTAVQQIRDADGCGCTRGFQADKSCGVIDHVIGNENFFAPPGLHVAGSGIVERAKNHTPRKEQNVGPVPETMA